MVNKVSISGINLISSGNDPIKRTIRHPRLSRQVKTVSHVSINLHPKGVGNGFKKYQAFSQEVIIGNVATVGYISNFRNSGEEGILIHGTKTGNVALFSHHVTDRKEFSVKEFISHIKSVHRLDLTEKNNSPLHVMACFGVSSGVYQAFSDELKRHVIGYGDGNAIATSGRLRNHFDENTSVITSAIGDVESDQPENILFVPASVHHYKPSAP